MPEALRLEDQIGDFPYRAVAASELGNIMRGLPGFNDRVGNRHREFHSQHHRNVRQIIANVGALIYRNSSLGHDLIQRFDLIRRLLSDISHAEIAGPALNSARCAPRDDSGLQSCPVKQRDSLTIVGVKCLLLVTVLEQLKPAIGEYTVAVHQQQLDAPGAAIDFRNVKV